MKLLRNALLAVVCTALSLTAVPAHADGDFPVVGRIASTVAAAGGTAVVGVVASPERKLTINSVNGYSQLFDNPKGVSTVVWNRLSGGWATTPKTPNPRFAKVASERDALFASGLRQGVIFRSGEVHPTSTADRLNMAGLLYGGKLIDLRNSGTRDPNLPSVTELRFPMTGTTNPATFVTRESDRISLGKALKAIADEDGPVLVHCHLGRDRTGWLVTVLLMLGGVDLGLIKKEYLRTKDTSGSNFDKGVTALYDNFDGVTDYLERGMGLSPATVAKLEAKIAAR